MPLSILLSSFLGLPGFFLGLGKGNNGLILFQNSSEISQSFPCFRVATTQHYHKIELFYFSDRLLVGSVPKVLISILSLDIIRTYVLEEQNQVRQSLWIKVAFQTVYGLMLMIFQFNCVSPNYNENCFFVVQFFTVVYVFVFPIISQIIGIQIFLRISVLFNAKKHRETHRYHKRKNYKSQFK